MAAFTSASLSSSLPQSQIMTMTMVTLTLLLLVITPSCGFVIGSASARNTQPTVVVCPSKSRLYLVPEQGKQLVAAFNAASVKKVKHNHQDNASTSTASAAVVVEAPSLLTTKTNGQESFDLLYPDNEW